MSTGQPQPSPRLPEGRVPGPPEPSEGTTVILGNPSPHMQITVFHPETGEPTGYVGQPAKHLNQSETQVWMRPGFDDPDHVELTLSTDNDDVLSMIGRWADEHGHRGYTIGIAEVRQLIQVHSGGAKPTWVSSNDPGFQKALAEYFNCAEGRPSLLLTNGGRDVVHAQHLSTSAQPAACNYIALTASTTAPAATDTVLTGEITTAGGGLIRAQGTYAHTVGTNTSTLTKTFTANGSDTLPVTIAQIGVFNASAGGTLAYHTALSATATLNVSGDNLTVTETVTAG